MYLTKSQSICLLMIAFLSVSFISCNAETVSVPKYNILVSVDNGTPIIDPPKTSFSEGEQVSVMVYPHPGYEFSYWSGDVSGTEDWISVIINSDLHINASCVLDDQEFEWPTIDNTGIPSGAVLTTYTGGSNTTEAGQVFENLIIDKRIYINHPNVVFRNCLLAGAADDSYVIYMAGAGYGLLIERCEITNGIAIKDGFTARGNYVHAPEGGYRKDGFIFKASNILFEGNLIQGLVGNPGAHVDGIQIMGGKNITVRNNWLDIRVPELVNGGVNASLFFSPSADAPLENIVIDHNMLIQDNGTVATYYPLRITGAEGSCIVQSNVWSSEYHGDSGPYSISSTSITYWEGNKFDDGTNIEAP